MAIHFVALDSRVANRRLLIDEVRHDARELAADNVPAVENARHRVHRQRRIAGVQLELDIAAYGSHPGARKRLAVVGRNDPPFHDRAIFRHWPFDKLLRLPTASTTGTTATGVCRIA